MKKTKLQLGLALALFLLGLLETVSGFVLWLALPSANGAGKRIIEPTVWAMTRHNWIDIHDWAAVGLIAITVVHIAIHWKWVVRMVRLFIFQGNVKLNQQTAIPVNGEIISIKAEEGGNSNG